MMKNSWYYNKLIKSLKGKAGEWDVHRDFEKLLHSPESLEDPANLPPSAHAQEAWECPMLPPLADLELCTGGKQKLKQAC